MSRHQAYRNYDYENDLDEYAGEGFDDEEDELSPEDRAQMAAGTSQVRTQLGDQSSKISTQQIEEALWHYYYDVEKSVAYLITKYVAATPAKPQKTSIAGGSGSFITLPSDTLVSPEPPGASAASALQFGHPGLLQAFSVKNPRPPTLNIQAGSMAHKHTSFSDFFHDMPWLHIPDDRRAVFIEPVRPPGGLLGGSKLQALAAARKKKAEEQKIENQNPAPITTQTAPETAKAAEKRVGPLSQRLNAVRLEDSGSRAADQTPLDPMELDGAPTDPVPPTGDTDRVLEEEEYVPPAPSAFAQTLFGSSSDKPTPQPPRRFQMPWMMYTSPEALTNAFSEPSPDDKVLAAQAKASNKKLAAGSTKKKVGSESKDNGPAAALKGLKIDDTPLPKSKNLDVISEFERAKSKKSASFVVVGHVDAGKSTLMGRLLLDLGVVDQRTIQKYRKEAESIGKSSFALAWVLDQRSEERSRGVTIDIATNKFETDSTSFTILDAPGHRDFIPNMIAGASQADFAILVVDASTGAFEAGLKGQTKEHSLLLRSMGVSRIIVAVNKLDTVSWSEERFEEISNQVSGFLSATGFQLKNVTFVPVSGLNGDNLVNKSQDVDASWYTGNTLIAELENSEPMTRALTKPLRMTISEVFRTSNSPITVSGRIDAGSLQAGDALLVQPSGEKAYVKSLELDQEPRDWAVAGQNIVIHLANIDPIHVRVGDIICDTKQPITCIDEFTVKVLAFDVLMPMQVDVHRGRLHAAGQIKEISALLDKVKGTVLKKKPKIVKPASVARVVVNMGAKVPLEVGQRVVLRCGGETVAAGLLE